MRIAYPVVISKDGEFYMASVPDCEIDTQGESVVDAIVMVRDAISVWCVCEEDAGRALPIPSELAEIVHESGDIVTLVDADINAYRRALEICELKVKSY